MELPSAIRDLKKAALANIAIRNGFTVTDNDIDTALNTYGSLEAAFNALLQRENGTVRFSYAVRSAFRKMTDWYSDTRLSNDR